ncbi:hypothetical protein R5W24_004458 [Gemmata sp. JC717]|uniref:hypothetical protein n=1 Tax=Gemmata algarum TaxID=2975278 RepID=UPI0021BB9601|nr:hypothetical protein [Gemmata algarum]MDY3555316.1 hypothetical protein [Gemmata algarum]
MSDATKAKLYSDRSARPAMLAPIWDTIPASLRALPQWIAWELRWIENRACWAKVPLDVRGVNLDAGYSRAKSDTPRTWTTFEQVRNAWGRTYGTYTPANPDGPGYVFNGGGIVGIDGDKCRDPQTGDISAFGRALMARFPGYWEVSPSGTGIKGAFFGTIADGKGRKFDYPEGHGIELYDRGRYFAITGRRVDGATADLTSIAEQLPQLVAEIDALKAARKPARPARSASATAPIVRPEAAPLDTSEKTRRARAYLSTVEGAVEYHGGDNATFRAACVLVVGFDLTPAQAFPLLADWNQTCSPPWPESWLVRKLAEADKTAGPRGELLHAEREGQQRGYLNLTDAQVDELLRGLGKTSAVPAADQAVTAVAERIAGDLIDHAPTTPQAEPDACALYAAHDIDAEIALLSTRCLNLRPVLMEKDGRPFVCDRPCGNGTACRPCLDARLLKKTREGNAYLVRTTTSVAAGESPRAVYAALVDSSVKPGTSRWNTLTKKVADKGGERCSLLTEDAGGVAQKLGRTPEASGFFLEDNKASEESRLWLLSLPQDAGETTCFAGVTFRKVAAANAMWAWFHGVKTVPDAPEEGTFKPHHQSSEWGDEEAKIPSNVKALRPSKFDVQRTAKILDRLHVESYSVRFDLRQGAEPGVGWVLPETRSLAMTLWLGGVGADFTPTIGRVVELAQSWLPLIPTDLGKGRRVETLLRQHIWALPLHDLTAQLRAADEEDRAEEAARAEASQLYAALRDSYRGREHEATGLLAELLA